MKYKLWNKKDTLYAPTGKAFSKEVIFEQYPLAKVDGVDFIICDAPISMGVFMEYSQTKETYKNMGAEINNKMSKQEVLDAITAFENKPAEKIASVEERTAASLEALVMLNMSDVKGSK